MLTASLFVTVVLEQMFLLLMIQFLCEEIICHRVALCSAKQLPAFARPCVVGRFRFVHHAGAKFIAWGHSRICSAQYFHDPGVVISHWPNCISMGLPCFARAGALFLGIKSPGFEVGQHVDLFPLFDFVLQTSSSQTHRKLVAIADSFACLQPDSALRTRLYSI